MKKAFLFIAALAMSVSLSAEKITTVAGITSGNKYYVGATTGDKDYYFYVDGSAKTESIKGVAKEDVADAVALTFTAVTSGWTIQFDNGLYLGLKNDKDNGAVQVMEEAVVWTIEENADKGLLKLHPNDYYLQKNNSGTQFGSYKHTQTDVWLESAGAAPTPAILEGIVIKGEASKLEYFVGETFDPAGLEVWGIYTKTVKGDSTSQIKSGITWSFDPEVFALGNTSVAVTATYKDFTSEVFTVNSIVVKEKVVPTGYAGVYTSNVELSTEGGTSASAAKVSIDEDEYDAIKAGTGSVAGACVVTIPANTKTLHFHAAGWKTENVTLDVNGTEYTLTADAGVANNTPFILQNNPAEVEYFTLDPKGATSITFAATAGKRFVLFGVNAETGDTPTKELVSLEIGGAATVLAYNVGDKFDVAGLTVTGTYDDESTEDVTSKVTWVINPETFAVASESASVEVTAKIGAIESAPFQVSGIVVTEKPAPVGTTYTKVTAAPDDWAGEYIVVYEVEGAARVFNGLDAIEDFDAAEISDNTITGGFNTVILEAVDGGYVVKINGGDNNGKYLTSDKDENGLKFGETGVTMTVSYDAESASTVIANPAGAVLRYNKTSGQDRFRFYKSTSYTNQQPIQLYKKSSVGSTGIREAMVNANVRKAMVNGRLIIVKGEKAFDLQGRIVK